MRGDLRETLTSLEVRSRIRDNRISMIVRSDEFRVFSVLGAVGLAMTFSVAGILSGTGIFLLSMLDGVVTSVVLSSLLFSFSVATFLVCYMWLTR